MSLGVSVHCSLPSSPAVPQGEDDKASGKPGMASEDTSRWVTGRTEEEARANADAKHPGKEFRLVQDEDVLDTWCGGMERPALLPY